MHIAAAAGHADTVKLLLIAGGRALVETTDLSKRTPLSRACEMGRAAVVKTLIDSGAQVNDVKDQEGQSLLHWFVYFHFKDCQVNCRYAIVTGEMAKLLVGNFYVRSGEMVVSNNDRGSSK